MNCTNCGRALVGDAGFCAGCGTPAASQQTNPPAAEQQPFTANAEQENKAVFLLAYLGILFFLPLVVCPHSKTGRFHANQGLLLLIASVAGQIVISILSTVILALSWRLWMVTSLLSWGWAIAMLALVVIGMVNANKGEQKPLPVIGTIRIIK